MATTSKNWFEVDRHGLKQVLAARGKEFILFELISNAWDEQITCVEATLSRPVRGRSELIVTDDSPDGFRDLTHSFTMYAPSSKKTAPQLRGRFNQGEKAVLALCEEASITSTTGQVLFTPEGRKHTKKTRPAGTEFRGVLKLTVEEWERIVERVQLLLPDVRTIFNGVEIKKRTVLSAFNVTLPTVDADEEGNLRSRKRATLVQVFQPLEGETPTLYELGIPVVETGDTWHVSIEQKVPLAQDRDNVTPAYLTAVRVAVLNHMSVAVTPEMAAEPWVRAAAGDPRVESQAFKNVLGARFGDKAVSYDPSDIGSNREASSQDFKVISGGSLSAGEWYNVRRTGALAPAGQIFPTDHKGKVPEKTYTRSEWTFPMEMYARFVEEVSPELVGHRVTITYIHDPRMVCGQFFGTWFNANLALHNVEDWQANIELMLHELAHTKVQSNDHLCRDFYDTVGEFGAKLALLAFKKPELAAWLSKPAKTL